LDLSNSSSTFDPEEPFFRIAADSDPL